MSAMSILRVSLVVLGLHTGMCFAHQGEEGEATSAAALDPESQAVTDTLSSFAEAFERGDVDAIRGLTSAADGFSHFEGTFADWSWDSYAGHLAEEMPLFTETNYRITNARPVVMGDMAFATYDWAIDVVVVSDEFAGGRHPVEMRGIATVVFLKSGGDWKIRHMHTARKRAAPVEH